MGSVRVLWLYFILLCSLNNGIELGMNEGAASYKCVSDNGELFVILSNIYFARIVIAEYYFAKHY